jgi:hypothetical protein
MSALLHYTTAASTSQILDHESFAVFGLLVQIGSAFYTIRIRRLMIYDPYFLPPHSWSPSADVLYFARCGPLAGRTCNAKSAPILGLPNEKTRQIF